ncbi:Retrotransposon gag domain [Sesbania bispinosa]|nr:Retrotransposon gag domain [Sesbania bispinosa]
MVERARRMTPRRLSFNLDDFPETDGERIDLNTAIGGERLNDGPRGGRFITPTVNSVGGREELNLLSGFETPEMTVTKNDTQAMIPVDILKNLTASQQSLVNLVTGLKAQTKEGETNLGGQHAQKHAEHPLEPQDDVPFTQGELRRLLQAGKNNPNLTFDLEPPLAEEILITPYPVGYQPPSFRKFDRTGGAREHLMCFMDDLGVQRNNKELRLKEFSKSLSGRAFTWYVKLRPHSIKTWEELAAEFCGKFLEEEGALHIMDLGRVKQKAGEGLLAFIKRYSDRASQCKETLPEADLVYGCIKNIEDGYQIFLSLGEISTFAELIRKGTDVAEAMKRQSKRTKEADNAYDICALEERERKRGFKSNQPIRRFIPSDIDDLPPSLSADSKRAS